MDYISVSPINPTSIFSFQNADLGVSSGRVIRPSGTHVALILRVRLTCVRAANVSEHFGTRRHSEHIPCVNTYDCLPPQRLKGVDRILWAGNQVQCLNHLISQRQDRGPHSTITHLCSYPRAGGRLLWAPILRQILLLVNLRILSAMSRLLPTSRWSRSVSSWTGVVCQFNKIWTFFLKLWVLHKIKGPLSTCLTLSALEASSAGPDNQVARSSGPWLWSLAVWALLAVTRDPDLWALGTRTASDSATHSLIGRGQTRRPTGGSAKDSDIPHVFSLKELKESLRKKLIL